MLRKLKDALVGVEPECVVEKERDKKTPGYYIPQNNFSSGKTEKGEKTNAEKQ